MKRKTLTSVISAVALATSAGLAHAADKGEVEVLHWWTSGGEAKSAAVLKEMLEKQGYGWKDFAVAGGGGESAMTVLKTRAVSGNPPAAAQIKGHDIQEWADLGFLTTLDGTASAEKWEQVLPKVVSSVMKYDDKYVAVPVNVHRVNWLWANPAVFEKAGAKIPTTWDEFIVAADKIKAAGLIPLAHGGQAWQDATVFEAIALETMGAELYMKAFKMHDPDALGSVKMVETFEKFRTLKQYIDKDSPGRDWNIATNMVIEGKAGMQIMGDWAKGEFAAAGKKPGVDYICAPAPGTAGMFTFNIDSFAFFNLKDANDAAAQQALAKTILSPKFQEVFNLNKGSIPVRLDQDMSAFDQCALDSMATFKAANTSGKLVPSWSHGLATTSQIQGAIYDVVTNYFNDDKVSATETVDKLVRAVKSAM
ncbi:MULTISPECIES: ABC transporter substrate-binding protein [Corallincola]|uniref:Probable sugar-binding periplasmic protein n=3 Tax=Corallincola TaxID=1775176 RepID=A0A368NI89_9GAMM|nr:MULTISPECIES: ABC transporter substrate-binding protein [Corallincola]RCU49139.1 carbohydrate ABC transporter substrate-binding protein [Corallincola holothuriorum]TAA47548.1 carbohydrate ABC transporter substrate-binding protein [Corallincola spongiicola]TCI05231.1 carbohydrate ABC transporter substrate-binding protein [Corallincola luteus]